MGDAGQDFIDQLDQGDEPDDDGQLGGGGEEPSTRQQLTMFDRWLELQQQGHIDPQMSKGVLKQMRHAISKSLAPVKQLEKQAFEAGKREARAEFVENPEQLREQFRAEIRQELLGETQRERSLGRLGVPPPLQGLFADVPADDFKAWQKRADQLHAAGVHWGDGDPLVSQIAQQRLQAAQQAAGQAQQNGQPVSLAPGNGIPSEVQEQLIRGATEAMQAGQAGGEQLRAPDLAGDIRKMADNPGAHSEEQILSVADRFNRDLDVLSRGMQGGAL
jgi:hypothetical protein